MPRPQGVQPDNIPGRIVDATALTSGAASASKLQRSYVLTDMPRLREAGAGEGTAFSVTFRFLRLEANVAIDGELDGVAKLTCQRCMRAVDVPLQDRFNLVVVSEGTQEQEEFAGYEPIEVDPTRLDLQQLAEDQALLALPLVPRHESEACSEDHGRAGAAEASTAPAAAEPRAPEGKQLPFGNLRDLMRKH